MEQELNIPDAAIQYVLDEDGNTTGVIIPIDLWREISAESEKMRQFLLETKNRETGAQALQAKRDRLRAISDTYHVQLPKHYRFNRAELHER